MSGYQGSSGLSKRTGYPSRTQVHSHLDVPMADEYPSGGDGGGGNPGAPKARRKGGKNENAFVRWFKGLSFVTKASIAWALFSLMVCYLGFRSIRMNNASVWLTCTSEKCTLDLTPPGRKKGASVTFGRNQIVRSDVVKVTYEGNIRQTVPAPYDSGEDQQQRKNKKGKYSSASYLPDKGPDANGLYDSYTLVLREKEEPKSGDGGASALDPDAKYRQGRGGRENNLAPLFALTEPDDDGTYTIHMRMFTLGESLRRASTMVSRINSYKERRRHKITIRETKNVSWQSVLAIVLGVFSFILSLVLGTFWEEEEKVGGPGARRHYRTPRTNGPRAPAGYGNYGGYRPQSQGQVRSRKPSAKPSSVTGYGSYGGYKPNK